jgi:RNA polymerase sigma-70 factor (ECF subfamily)
LNDLDTINFLREGDEKVFRQVFDEYHRRVYAYIFKKTGSSYIAEETMQLTFVKLWKYRRSLNAGHPMSAHVFRIASTTLIDLIRSEKNKQHLLKAIKDQPDTHRDPGLPVEESELKQRVKVIVRSMPEMQKKVFEMSRFEEKTHREIALALSISVKTVETHISRALKFLRQHLNLLNSIFPFF